MRTNVQHANANFTHEGGLSTAVLTPAQELRRAVTANLLFEGTFYESGEAIAKRIRELVKKVSFDELAQIAIDAREKMKLRHVPLLLVREAIRYHHGRQVGDLIARVIQRPDEAGELLALYWSEDRNQPLTAQMKIGLARALKKFNVYQLAKWDTPGMVKLRDVLFLSHAKPSDDAQAEVFKRLAEGTLPTPDTWEVQLSGGADKKETFTRLISERKLGALAMLRNLRNMIESGVDEDIIREGLARMNAERVLPFRFISAAKYAPRLEDALEEAMMRCLNEIPKLGGKTAILIDHSASMNSRVSDKSEISRFDAAAAMAMILREVCDRTRVFTFSDACIEIPPRRGFAMVAEIQRVRNPVGTLLGKAVKHVYSEFPECDRIIVVTDEQSADRPQHPQGRGYIINVAPYAHGIGYGPWITIDGWSEAVIEYIRAIEATE